jgi:hypothetical protein
VKEPDKKEQPCPDHSDNYDKSDSDDDELGNYQDETEILDCCPHLPNIIKGNFHQHAIKITMEGTRLHISRAPADRSSSLCDSSSRFERSSVF